MKTQSGDAVFPLGIGSWQLGGAFLLDEHKQPVLQGPVDVDQEVDALARTFSLGANYIDVCHHYGYGASLKVVARALVDQIREDIFVNVKLESFYRTKEEVKERLYQYLDILHIPYVDSYQMHATMDFLPHHDVLEVVQELLAEGVVKSLSVSNFNAEMLDDVVGFGIVPVSHELYLNLAVRFVEEGGIVAHGETLGIKTIAYKPLMRNDFDLTSLGLVSQIAQKNEMSVSQLFLHWLVVHQGQHAIVKATNPHHIQANFASLDFSLTAEEYYALDQWRPAGYTIPEIDWYGNDPSKVLPWKVR